MEEKEPKVRTRFAPSPTGEPHVGNIRTALFSWLFACHENGTFILRIEDTDQQRSKEGSVLAILKALDWLGIDIDEGVYFKKEAKESSVGEKGDCGPYFQSKRLEIYKEHALKLVASNHAYYCFCTPERLEVIKALQQENKEPPRYDQYCLKLSSEEIKSKLEAGEKYVIRLKVPNEGQTEFNDYIKGKIVVKNSTIDHQVLLKSDGFPTYHLASVVDDHLMKISHVIRADEWLSSTPKHIMLYDFFGWEKPIFVHLPIILATDKTKLSKRGGAVSILDYMNDYIPDAILNYLALLGWNPKTNQEILSRKELIEQFGLEKINKNNPIFDVEKLNWLNSIYIKNKEYKDYVAQKIKEIISKEKPNLKYDKEKMDFAISMAISRIRKLSEFTQVTSFLWDEKIEYGLEILLTKNQTKDDALEMLEVSLVLTKRIKKENWDKDYLKKYFLDFCKENKLDRHNLLWPLRVAITGKRSSPDVFESMEACGIGLSEKRVWHAINLIKKTVKK